MKRSEKITTSDYVKLGIEDLNLIKTIGKTAKKLLNEKLCTKADFLDRLKSVFENPNSYLSDEHYGVIAIFLQVIPPEKRLVKQPEHVYSLQEKPLPYRIYGVENIDTSAIQQMNTAMQLPIAVAGALMPDAHHGYGLPIGGVLATELDKIIPYAVGVDIACRMCLSVFDIPANYLEKNTQKFKNFLLKNTCFGTGNGFEQPLPDDLFDKSDWKATKIIRDLKDKAWKQVGSSGTGNHFVEWGLLDITQEPNVFGLLAGNYIALLSHSGSRGFGANIAGYYSKLAMEKTKLPQFAKHLAWLDMNTQEGQEYWVGMNLAGEYASANHHHIHRRMAMSLAQKPVKMIENHHNFAWKETLENGQEVIVHRKGATPAHVGELGIIPGSMTKPGFVVRGKGDPTAIFSASHGAGRMMSRSQAKRNITRTDLERALQSEGVLLLGADIDEAPMAYKNIEQVMNFQRDLVEVLAKFQPKIVRMAEPEHTPKWMNKKKRGGIDFNET